MSAVRIVLADDHPIFRKSLKIALDMDDDFEVVGEATNGLEAVERTGELKPDVVVMDAAMPALGGIEATRRITATCTGSHVVALSQYDDQETVFHMFDAGAMAYVTKSGGLDDLFRAIRRAAVGERYLDHNLSDALVEAYLELKRRDQELKLLPRLTPREREVVQLVAEGHRPKHIAAHLGLSVKTIESHRNNAMKKIGVKHVPGLVKWAIKQRLIDGDP